MTPSLLVDSLALPSLPLVAGCAAASTGLPTEHCLARSASRCRRGPMCGRTGAGRGPDPGRSQMRRHHATQRTPEFRDHRSCDTTGHPGYSSGASCCASGDSARSCLPRALSAPWRLRLPFFVEGSRMSELSGSSGSTRSRLSVAHSRRAGLPSRSDGLHLSGLETRRRLLDCRSAVLAPQQRGEGYIPESLRKSPTSFLFVSCSRMTGSCPSGSGPSPLVQCRIHTHIGLPSDWSLSDRGTRTPLRRPVGGRSDHPERLKNVGGARVPVYQGNLRSCNAA